MFNYVYQGDKGIFDFINCEILNTFDANVWMWEVCNGCPLDRAAGTDNAGMEGIAWELLGAFCFGLSVV